MTNLLMKELLEKNDAAKLPKIGDIIEGTVIGQKGGAVYIDLGSLGTGIIYGRELIAAKDILKETKTGDKVFAKIVELEGEEGYIELSVSAAGQEIAWLKLKEIKEKGEVIPVKILGANKGGLLAEVSGLAAFLPTSQLAIEHYPKVEDADPAKILRELQRLVGKELNVKILDSDVRERRLIISEKAIEADKLREILKNYKAGDVVEGEISAIADFGAFIKFQGLGKEKEYLEGLCHLSELDWKLISNPSEIVKVGQAVKAKIIDISNERISLSLKALKEDPWRDIEKKIKKGDTVKGQVVKFNHFGALVEVLPQVYGLCHISEFGSQKRMEEKIQLGKLYDLEITFLDPAQHKMILRLAQS